MPPRSVSRSTLGPEEPPCDWKIASTPVRCVVTPGGAFAAIAARVCLIGRTVVNVDSPAG